MTETIEQQLAAARAELERLTALLPPLPAAGQVWRVGSKCASNLYAHSDELAPKGEPVGVMRSAELAAHVVRAVNAWNRGSETTVGTEGGRDDLRAVREFTDAFRPTSTHDRTAPDATGQDRTDADALREQIAETFTTWATAHMTACEHTQLVSFGEAADAVMAVVRPVLGQRDDEIARLEALVTADPIARARADLRALAGADRASARAWDEICIQIEPAVTALAQRTETAEAERDQALVDLETAKGWRDALREERDQLRRERNEYRTANTRMQQLITLRTDERDWVKTERDKWAGAFTTATQKQAKAEGERDQLKAALDRVTAVLDDMDSKYDADQSATGYTRVRFVEISTVRTALDQLASPT